MRINSSLKKQSGVVIIVAMLMVALMASLAYLMLMQVMRDTRRTELIVSDASVTMMCRGAVLWAKDALTQDWIRQKSTQVVDALPMHLAESVVQGYQVSAVVEDANAKYNINNLRNEGAEADFSILLKAVSPTMSESEANTLSQNIALWLKPVMMNDTLDRYYAELPQPYRAGHRLMTHVSELKWVKGMTPTLMQAILPYVIALPETTTINPQTASIPVLMTLSPSLSPETAKAFVGLRQHAPVLNGEAFKALPLMMNHAINSDKISTVSTYFELQTTVSRNKVVWNECTLLSRTILNGRPSVHVLYEARGECV